MAPREVLTERVRAALAHMPGVTERRMFGGTTFMVNGKMCISAGHHHLMCRIDPELHATAIARRGVRTVRMKGRAYRRLCLCARGSRRVKERPALLGAT